MPPLRLSVILPTFNRSDCLPAAIDALLGQGAESCAYEVIVVDNNSTDQTRAILASRVDPRLRVVEEARQGLSFARNAGLAVARGELVAFTDDDVEAAPDWVVRIVGAFEQNAGIDGVGGRVLPVWSLPPPAWLTRDHWAPLALQDHGDVERIFDASAPVGLVGANVAFRREVFARVGQFSPHVQRVKDGIGSTEDHELLTRLYAAGGRMLYVPRMLVRARVQADRYTRGYHRRWYRGHGRFHAMMRAPEMERSRMAILGVPSHLLRSAGRDAGRMAARLLSGDREGAFAAELRLRFFQGFVESRLGLGSHGRRPEGWRAAA